MTATLLPLTPGLVLCDEVNEHGCANHLVTSGRRVIQQKSGCQLVRASANTREAGHASKKMAHMGQTGQLGCKCAKSAVRQRILFSAVPHNVCIRVTIGL